MPDFETYAFPRTLPTGEFPPDDCVRIIREHAGMTLREYLTGQALQGLCANPGGPFQANVSNGWGLTNCTAADVASTARQMAEAAMRELAP